MKNPLPISYIILDFRKITRPSKSASNDTSTTGSLSVEQRRRAVVKPEVQRRRQQNKGNN